MDHPKDRMVDFFIFSTLILVGFLYICISNRQTFLPLQKFRSQPSTSYKMMIYRDELEEALAKASMEDKTVIITVVNKAYTDDAEGDKAMLDLFLDGFWVGEGTQGLIKNLLVAAVDQTSFQRCQFLKLHCYKLETQGIDFGAEQLYMSHDYINMMWTRTLFLSHVLKLGYNFIFTDTDILWLRNPFPRLSGVGRRVDLQISTDKYNGKQWSDRNQINTGLYMMRSNNKTIALLDELYGCKDSSKGLKEQDVLVNLMHGGIFKRLGLKVRFLDTMFFSGFCEDSRDVNAVVTVHANCCRYISAKLTDLIHVIHDWKRFKYSNSTGPGNHTWSNNHVACRDSWTH